MERTVSSSYLNQDGPTWACTPTALCWAFKDVCFVSELFPKFLYWVYLALCTGTVFFSTKTCTCQLWAGIVSNRAVLLAFKVFSTQRTVTMNLQKAWECLLINIHTWRVGKFVPTSDTRYCIFLAEVYRVGKGNKKVLLQWVAQNLRKFWYYYGVLEEGFLLSVTYGNLLENFPIIKFYPWNV